MKKLAAALAFAAMSAGAQAQSFPSRPITMVVALPAGGAVDALARVMADHMRVTLGQTVVVENMGGAGGTLSINRVVRSAPDGYTLGMGTLGQYVISGAIYPLQFDMLADLSPVALLPNVPYWLVARKGLPPNSLKELVDWLKANPDKASATSVGTASMARFCGMGFQKATGTSFQFVPYRGGAPALNDLVAGQVDLSCDLGANSLAQYRTGNIKAYAVMTKSRWFVAPDVPTAEEAGRAGTVSTARGTASGRRRTRPRTWWRESTRRPTRRWPIRRCRSASPRWAWTCRRRVNATPAAFAAFHKAEVEKWYPIVKAAGVKPPQ